MSIYTVAKTVLAILPTITDVLVSIEQINTEPGNGKYKKELALAIIKTIYDATNPAVSFDQLSSFLNSTIDAVVAFLNTTNAIFKKLPKAA